jgi:hypothetical protein
MAKRIILLLVAGMMVSCIYNKRTSIEDWQAGLKSEHPKITNILLQADQGFFFSFNKLGDDRYSFFYKNANEHKLYESIENWLETYINEKKLILDAGYPTKSGITFKQTEKFNRLHFNYRIGGSKSFIFTFFQNDGKWQYDGGRDE